MAVEQKNLCVFLSSRPGVSNPPTEANFSVKHTEVKSCEDGEVLLKTLFLSVDPYMRCRLNEESGASYVSSWKIGETLQGGGVGVVVESRNESFKAGDVVQSMAWPWQTYAVFFKETESWMSQPTKVESDYAKKHPSLVLGILGMTGLTSLIGLQEKAHIQPGKNQTVVVSGAAGACGSVAGQISKLMGSGRVIGICGSDEKGLYIKELGFDGFINYKTTKNLREELESNCPDGVDVYFDNVGGEVSNDVIRCMNKDSNIVLCGQISTYNKDVPYPNPVPKEIEDILRERNIARDRFLILNYKEKFPVGLKQLETWIHEGKLKNRETIEIGLEHAGKAFVSMMKGGNIGKQLVKVLEH